MLCSSGRTELAPAQLSALRAGGWSLQFSPEAAVLALSQASLAVSAAKVALPSPGAHPPVGRRLWCRRGCSASSGLVAVPVPLEMASTTPGSWRPSASFLGWQLRLRGLCVRQPSRPGPGLACRQGWAVLAVVLQHMAPGHVLFANRRSADARPRLPPLCEPACSSPAHCGHEENLPVLGHDLAVSTCVCSSSQFCCGLRRNPVSRRGTVAEDNAPLRGWVPVTHLGWALISGRLC